MRARWGPVRAGANHGCGEKGFTVRSRGVASVGASRARARVRSRVAEDGRRRPSGVARRARRSVSRQPPPVSRCSFRFLSLVFHALIFSTVSRPRTLLHQPSPSPVFLYRRACTYAVDKRSCTLTPGRTVFVVLSSPGLPATTTATTTLTFSFSLRVFGFLRRKQPPPYRCRYAAVARRYEVYRERCSGGVHKCRFTSARAVIYFHSFLLLFRAVVREQ